MVVVYCCPVGDAIAGDDLLLTVVDDGSGLSEQELVVVEEGAEKPLRHGSGLGLWMVDWLAIACGGSISATTDDSGTTINVRVPLRDTEDESPRADPTVDSGWAGSEPAGADRLPTDSYDGDK